MRRMLKITVPATEQFNEKTQEFIYTKEQTLELEHSLISLSKWESKWCKSFLSKNEKTYEETKAQEYKDGFGYGKMTYAEYNRTDSYGADYVYMYRPTIDNKSGSWSVRRTFGYDMNYLSEENLLDKF